MGTDSKLTSVERKARIDALTWVRYEASIAGFLDSLIREIDDELSHLRRQQDAEETPEGTEFNGY